MSRNRYGHMQGNDYQQSTSQGYSYGYTQQGWVNY